MRLEQKFRPASVSTSCGDDGARRRALRPEPDERDRSTPRAGAPGPGGAPKMWSTVVSTGQLGNDSRSHPRIRSGGGACAPTPQDRPQEAIGVPERSFLRRLAWPLRVRDVALEPQSLATSVGSKGSRTPASTSGRSRGDRAWPHR